MPQIVPIHLTWESLPTARQQELTHLLAALLYQYLAAQKDRATCQRTQEITHDQPPQNQ